MSWIGEMWRRGGMLLRGERFDRELDEELRLHREMKERELSEGGVAADEAKHAANRAFGNFTSLRERTREAWGWRWLENFVEDCWYGARGLRKNPGYAATTVITLILGIGATTAIFSVVNTVLLRPLPYIDPSRLVQIEENHDGATNFSYATYRDLVAARPKSLEEIASYRPWTFNISGGAEPEASRTHPICLASSAGLSHMPTAITPAYLFRSPTACRARRPSETFSTWIDGADLVPDLWPFSFTWSPTGRDGPPSSSE